MKMKLISLFLTSIITMMMPSLVFANTTTSEAVSNRAFIKITDRSLGMNFRAYADDPNTTGNPMGVLRKDSIIQLPDGMTVFDSNGQLDLAETLRLWEHKTQVDPKFAPLKPKNCKGTNYKCVPVRVIKSSDSRVSDGTIGYLSLDYIQQKVSKDRYATTRVLQEFTSSGAVDSADGATSPGGEVTNPGTTDPVDSAGGYTSSEVMNCNNTIYRSSGYLNHSCLKNLSLKQKAELVMSDVLKINQLRAEFKLDPRMSACMSYRESRFSPNAKGGTPDWGMYQVIDSTARSVLRRTSAVTPGFTGISWEDYRTKMLGSTMAQADLHHNVVYHKAKVSSADLNAMNSSMAPGAANVSSSVVQRIAKRYNGSGARATRYGNDIQSCYTCMTGISNKTGKVTNSAGLQGCLNKAL